MESSDAVELTMKRPGESSFPMMVTSVSSPEFGCFADPKLTLPANLEPLYLRQPDKEYSFEFLFDSKTLYVQYNAVVSEDREDQSLEAFSRRMVQTFRGRAAERLVIDVRHNTGGDNTTFEPLIDAMRDPAINRHGRLFLIMGRQTFSAAGNFVTAVEQRTNAILVGEGTGEAPNQFGDSELVRLPNSGLLLFISTRYHQRSDPDDGRLTHEPDVWAPLFSTDYFAGRDPALDAVLNFEP